MDNERASETEEHRHRVIEIRIVNAEFIGVEQATPESRNS